MAVKSGERITIDKELNIPVYSSVCSYCRHFDGEAGRRTCRAYPKGIPLEIWLGLHKHTTPFPGDHGIMFERWEKE